MRQGAIKRPPVVQGSTVVHRRPLFGHTTAGEREYFTRRRAGSAKPEVRA